MEALLLESVSKSFGRLKAVDNLCACVQEGTIYGFLGPNGAGKTTTIRMIMDIIRPDSGSISIFGDGAGKRNRSRTSYMPEERGLYPKMKLKNVLKYFGSIKNVPSREIPVRTMQWLERVGLSEKADKKVEELSRGMHQKLQFAVAAINEPDLFILDEPFAGLDPINQELFKDIILQLKEQGKTIIFSTHVMHEAEKLCDYILLINKGKIVIDGPLEQIKSENITGAVTARLEGDTGFIETLPIVTSVEKDGHNLDIVLKDNADPQQLLSELMGRVKVLSFEIKQPSLHEIFIKLVGDSDEHDS